MSATRRADPSAAELASGLDLLRRALEEDLVGGAGVDLTAAALEGASLRARIVARQAGVACGLLLAAETFRSCGANAVDQPVRDGDHVAEGETLLTVDGPAAGVLRAERPALNVVQRLSGTATLTRAFVDAVAGTDAQIVDTRKTIPGMRALQRWAVRCGGGYNHRFGLADEAMLKDNHIAACGDIARAVVRIRGAHPGCRVHVEADTLDQVREAVAAGADVVLLDNMAPAQLEEAVRMVAGAAQTEASGGATLGTVAAIAATGVDRISVGALTHSAPAFDAALDAVPVGR